MGAARVSVPSGPAAQSRPVARSYAPGPRSVKNIDFQRGELGEGNVIIELSDTGIAPDIQEQGGKIRVDFRRTQLPEPLRVRLDVKDFATPVQFVNSSATGDKASISIEPQRRIRLLRLPDRQQADHQRRPLTNEDQERRNSEKLGLHRREAVAELPGHRCALGAATDR